MNLNNDLHSNVQYKTIQNKSTVYFNKKEENGLLLHARFPNANAVCKSIIISLPCSDLCGSRSTIQPNIQLSIQQWHGVETLLALKHTGTITHYQPLRNFFFELLQENAHKEKEQH